MSFLSRIFGGAKARSQDANVFWPSKTSTWNWWQFANNRSDRDYADFAPVYTCWAIISQEIARVPAIVYELSDRGDRRLLHNNAAARVLRRPNSYQTASDFKLNLVQSLLSHGNAYAYAVRNARGEIAQLHPVNPYKCAVFLDTSDGSYYYQIADSESLALGRVDSGYWFPSRDMLHIRLFTYNHPLKGVTPLTAAAIGINAGLNINAQTAAFFGNMGRPSGIIQHPKALQPDTVARIKQRFIEATTGENAGAPVVFTEGMEWTPLTMSAVDAELIQSYKLSERQVAQIYRVPPFLLGDLEDAKFSTVEQLTRFFLNSGLGFYFEHIAESICRLFDLPANTHVEFDYETALLKSDFEARMRGYKEAIQGGTYTVNEARSKEHLPPVEYGDDVRMQQQMVPLSYGAAAQPAGTLPAPEPAPEPEPELSDSERRIRTLAYKARLAQRLAA